MGLNSLTRCVVTAAALLVVLQGTASAQTVAWDPNPEPSVAGYRVYIGTQSKTYTKQVDVGDRTSHTPTGLDWSKPLYFAVQAYTETGLSSPLSNELRWTPPVVQPTPTSAVLKNVTVSSTSPFAKGKPVTWTASATGATTIHYKFWMFRKGAWQLMQNYSTNRSFTWTPTWADQGGPYALQVWARAAGSTKDYESWMSAPNFEVASAPVQISADLEFPTPPDNPVTFKMTVADAGNEPLEYKFWIQDPKTNVWEVLREYSRDNEAVWVPESTGRYAMQGWARRVGSNEPYEVWAGRWADISRSQLRVIELNADPDRPGETGRTVTWTAKTRGGQVGPIEYQFWVYSEKKGWTVGQPWGPSRNFVWTPAWGTEGQNALQVWVRNAGSTAAYDSWLGTGLFDIRTADLHLTTTSLFPLAPGRQVNWLAEAADKNRSFEYQFWVYDGATRSWSVGKPYGPDGKFGWTPSAVGTYAIQAWARQSGSSAAYETWRGTGYFDVSQGPARIKALTSNIEMSARVGSRVVWTAWASGGSGPLEYQFWRWSGSGWKIVQEYGPSSSFGWTPTAADVGKHAVQVWVRSVGSSSQYEAYMGTAVFNIYQ
jgi:hypothetical protein